MVLSAVVLVGCADESRPITAPNAPAEFLASKTAGGGAANGAAGVVSCDLAVRSASGRYRTKTVTIRVPPTIIDPDGKTMNFGFRGWVEGIPDPTRLASCEIPATPAAVEWFKMRLSRGRLSEAPPMASPTTTTPGVTVYDGEGGQCDPYSDWNCECDTDPTGADCYGWNDGGEGSTGYPPPAEPQESEPSMESSDDGSGDPNNPPVIN
jgi:hypothetical protein